MIRPVPSREAAVAPITSATILRPRILAQIEAAAQHHVAMIVAPAGYGKSTALRQYLERSLTPVLRYDLQADATTLRGFVRGFAALLAEIAPDAERTVAGALESAGDSISGPAPGAGVELAAWLHVHLRSFQGLIAIDDVHLLEDSPESVKLLVSLVGRTKGRIHWILASRSARALPTGTWLAYQDMGLGIDEHDLAFSDDDARETARGSGVRLRDDELSNMVRLTGGWPIALTFALRTAHRIPDALAVATSTREMTYRYLAEQVYHSIDDEERHLLAVSADLAEIDCDVLREAGYPRAVAIMEGLKNKGAFVVQNPERPRVYRCHDLFRAFLLRQMELEGVDVAASAAAIGAANERLGRISDALALYGRARAWADVERLLETHGLALMEGSQSDAVAVAVEQLARANVADGSIAWALRGLLAARAGRFDEAEAALRRATKRSTDPELRAQLQLCRARIAVNSGGEPSELEAIEDDIEVSLATRTEAVSIYALVATRRGDRAEASAAIARASRTLIDITARGVRARVLQRLGTAETELGNFAVATAHLEASAELATEEGLLSLASRAYQGLCNVITLSNNDQTKFSWYAQQSSLMAAKAGDRLDTQQAVGKQLNAELRRGNLERVLVLEKQLAESKTSKGMERTNLSESQAMRAAWEGRFADALALAEPLWPKMHFASDRAVSGAQCAVYAALAGQAERSKHIVATVMDLIRDRQADPVFHPTNRSIAASFCALAEALCGRTKAATRMLTRQTPECGPVAAALASCVTRIVAILRNPAVSPHEVEDDLLELRQVGHGGWVSLFEAALKAHTGQTPRPDKLTPAEIDILRRLASERSFKEISAETGRSVFTLRTHAQRAIAKLGCHSRTEAIAVARRDGLL